MRHNFIITAISTLTTLAVISTAQCVELFVPSQYTTIQAAIDDANHGDVITVADGAYTGAGNRDIEFDGKIITLRSQNGPAGCIIDCQGSSSDPHRAFYLHQGEDPNAVIDGFTITNGYLTASGWQGAGAGLEVYNGGITLSNCVFRSNIVAGNSQGGAIYAEMVPLVLNGCVFQDNYAPAGGAIYCQSATLTMSDCSVIDNQADDSDGGGVCLWFTSTTVDNVVFTGNTTPSLGGALLFYDYGGSETIIVSNCHIYGNRALAGGGISCFTDYGTMTITNCAITGNHSDQNGGGLTMSGSTAYLTNCTVADNRAANNGGGISLYNNCDTRISNTILWNNQAYNNGDDIYLASNTDTDIDYNDIAGGEAEIYASGTANFVWTATNIDADPCFVAPGNWDPNSTPADPCDDYWIAGDYHLGHGSPCLDVGTNADVTAGATDIVGNSRIVNSIVDLGAYESDLAATKITIKAGKTRNGNSDSFSIKGECNAAGNTFEGADTIIVRVGPYSTTIDRTAFNQSGTKAKYSYKAAPPGLTSIKLDLDKNTFTTAAKNIDLTGLTAPVVVSLTFGDYYGTTKAADQGATDVVNGKKLVPIQLLSGWSDTLRVDKVKCTAGSESKIANLTIQGTITTATDIDLTTVPVIVQWGAATYTIDTGAFVPKGTGKYVYKKKPAAGDRLSVNATIDLAKCAFKIIMKNTQLTWQPSPVTAGLTFDTFDEETSVSF